MSQYKQVYLIGVGGIGMSALARHFKALGSSVSGSDLQDSKLLQELKYDGIKVIIGHKKSNIPLKVDLVIYNQAISTDNVEIKEVKKRSTALLSYPEAIGELTRQYKTIAIAGSHGKSTTTALTALILINAGFDPTVIVGTRMKELLVYNSNKKGFATSGINYRKGNNKWLVLEADEYGRAFHHYSPFAVLITNIDKEHLDTYKNLAGVKKSFLKFISNIQDDGILVLNSADKNTKSIESEIIKICKLKKVTIHWYDINEHLKGLSSLHLLPSLLGNHNVSNASGAYVLANALKISDQIIYSTLKNFKGTWRRLEYRGEYKNNTNNSISIYDDYAHHPTEIKATLSALQSLALINKVNYLELSDAQSNTRPIICVFQPHQTFRLESLFDEFVNAFKDADIIILLPVYKVSGRDKNKTEAKKIINSEKLAEVITKKYPDKIVIYQNNPKLLLKSLEKLTFLPHQSPILVMMGAGDIVKYTEIFLNDRN